MIYHIANTGRGSMSINQGLYNLGLEFATSGDYRSFGTTIKKSTSPGDFRQYDLIICGSPTYLNLFEKQNLWNKVIFYEYRDSCKVNKEILSKIRWYFKRSVSCGPERKMICDPVVALNHCVMDEYISNEVYPRIYNIGCFFDKDNWRLGRRRETLLSTLSDLNLPNSLIGVSTSHANDARLAVAGNKQTDNFLEFIRMMKQCKIVFTAQPEPVDGDNRTWEAFASGSLVFADISHIPTPNPPINGKHFIQYDATNKNSILEAVDKAKWYIRHEESRQRIAKQGYEHALKHHRCSNRVQFMIDHFNTRMFL